MLSQGRQVSNSDNGECVYYLLFMEALQQIKMWNSYCLAVFTGNLNCYAVAI